MNNREIPFDDILEMTALKARLEMLTEAICIMEKSSDVLDVATNDINSFSKLENMFITHHAPDSVLNEFRIMYNHFKLRYIHAAAIVNAENIIDRFFTEEAFWKTLTEKQRDEILDMYNKFVDALNEDRDNLIINGDRIAEGNKLADTLVNKFNSYTIDECKIVLEQPPESERINITELFTDNISKYQQSADKNVDISNLN